MYAVMHHESFQSMTDHMNEDGPQDYNTSDVVAVLISVNILCRVNTRMKCANDVFLRTLSHH